MRAILHAFNYSKYIIRNSFIFYSICGFFFTVLSFSFSLKESYGLSLRAHLEIGKFPQKKKGRAKSSKNKLQYGINLY